jgi:SAM-dependent methyltransferase
LTTDGPNEGQDGGTYGSAAAAEGWRRRAAFRAQDLGRSTERMLDLAEIGPGHRVLDVAAGTGEQTLLAARRVGPNGSVLATDIAVRLLTYLDESAKEAGLANVETRVMDARQLDLEPASFDAAICRMALMLIPDRDMALAGIRRALKPGKKLAVAVFSTAEKLPHIALSLAIARRHAGWPPAPFEDPGMFALGDPAVLRTTFERSGFHEVTIETVAGGQRFPSLAAAMQDRRDALPEMRPLLASLSDAEQDAVWAEIEEVMRQFEGVDGVVIPIERLLCVGTKEQDDP